MGSSGGGNGAGGGGATAPLWLQTIHMHWLSFTGSSTLSKSMADCLNDAFATNPYAGLAAFDPDVSLAAIDTAVGELETLIDAMNYHTDFDDVYTNAAAIVDTVIAPETHITALVDAQSTDLMTEYTNKLLPAFNAGYRDLGSIMTSAFSLGRAKILSDVADKVSKFRAELAMQTDMKRSDMINQATSEMLRLFVQKIEFTRTWAALVADTKRIRVAAKADQYTEDKLIDVSGARWNLEAWQYGANLLAASSGGTVTPGKAEGNQMARIIGGGLSGASAGALIGSRVGEGNSGYGALLGGIAGLIGGAMS